MRQNLSDAALVLLGHGTTLNAESAAPVYQHAAELRRRKTFENVHEAFWKQSPRVSEVISTLRTRRVFIVPLFLSEGYFSEEVIPQELGFKRPGQTDWARSLRRQDQTFFYCKPVGVNRRITDVLLDRAREVAESFPFPRAPKPKDTTLFIAGHGTDQNQNSRKAVERQVDLLRKLDLYAAVHGIFLEEEPRIGACYQLSQTKNMVIVPFFISDGLHTQEDIPRLLGEPERIIRQRLENQQPAWRNPTEKQRKLVWYSRSIGSDPCIADVILECVKEQAGKEPMKS